VGALLGNLRQAEGLYHRARFYLDLPKLNLLLRFRHLRKEYYSELWQTAARRVGASYSPWKYGYARISRDGLTTVVHDARVMLDDHLTLNIIGNKVLTHDLMEALHYRTPRHVAYSLAAMGKVRSFLAHCEGPVVVKPAAGTGGGRGITTGVTEMRDLNRASRLAARHGETLIAEEQVPGHSFRLLYLEGRLVDAIRRDPPTVTGDGRSTVRRLIARENRRRLAERPYTAMNPVTIDLDCRNTLAASGLALSSRPGAGERVVVKRTCNENNASENCSVREQVHPELEKAGSRLVQALGVSFAGLDLMSPDISKPLAYSDTWFLEVNTTPGLHHHYLISEPNKGIAVAELLLEHLFTGRRGVMEI
jgi:cyanophycin synthetase